MQKIGISCDKIVAKLTNEFINQSVSNDKNNISPDLFDQISETDQETDFSHFKQSNIQVTQQKDVAEVPAFAEDTVLKSAPNFISLPNPLSNATLFPSLPSFAALSTLAFNGASLINIPTCLLEHIIHTTTLTPLEKLYYLVADSLCMINLNKRNDRSISMPSHKWARILSCSRSKVFALQTSLESKGYFTVNRSKNRKGQSMRNTVITDIPGSVFEKLQLAKNREEKGKEYDNREDNILGNAGSSNFVSTSASIESFNPALESKREYLARSKLFIKINYHLLKSVFSNESLSSTAKILWLELYTKSYIKYRSSMNNLYASQEDYDLQNDLSVIHNECYLSHKDLFNFHKTLTVAISYKELEQKHVLSKSAVSRALKELVEHELLIKEQYYIKNNTEETTENNRQDKLLWFCILMMPNNIKEEIEINTKSLYFKNPQSLISNKHPSTIALYDPPLANTKPLYNKNYILKKIDQEKSNFLKKIFKGSKTKKDVLVEKGGDSIQELKRDTENIKQGNKLIQNSQITEQSVRLTQNDKTIEKGIKLNHIEPKLSLQTKLSSSIENPTTATYTNLKHPHFQNQKHPLSYFYPLLDEDAIYLRKSSSRDFSLNFINKLLLRLSHKYPDHGFYTKQIMLSYLTEVLKYELRQAPIVNNESFDFKPIKGSKEDENKKIEKYLNEVEQSLNTSEEAILRRKIAGTYEPKEAYRLLREMDGRS